MRQLLLIFPLLLVFCVNAVAQQADSTEKKPIQLKSKSASSGYYSPGFGQTGGSVPSYTFRVGYYGIEQKVSYFGDNLREIVKDNPEALAHMNTFAKKRKGMVTGFIMAGSGVLLTAVGLEKTGEQTFDPRTGQNEDKYGLKPIGIVGIGMAFTGIIVAAVNGNGATKYIENAVKAYNKGLGINSYDGETALRINFSPQITPDYIGAGFKVSLF